jgi:hypothetical protein
MACYHFNKILPSIGYHQTMDIQLYLAHVSLVFLHVFWPVKLLCGACFSCLLAHVFLVQHGSTCSSVQQKNGLMFFELLELFYVLLLPSRFKI